MSLLIKSNGLRPVSLNSLASKMKKKRKSPTLTHLRFWTRRLSVFTRRTRKLPSRLLQLWRALKENSLSLICSLSSVKVIFLTTPLKLLVKIITLRLNRAKWKEMKRVLSCFRSRMFLLKFNMIKRSPILICLWWLTPLCPMSWETHSTLLLLRTLRREPCIKKLSRLSFKAKSMKFPKQNSKVLWISLTKVSMFRKALLTWWSSLSKTC